MHKEWKNARKLGNSNTLAHWATLKTHIEFWMFIGDFITHESTAVMCRWIIRIISQEGEDDNERRALRF